MRLAIDGQKLGKLQILHLLNHSDDRFVVEVNTDNVMQRVSIRGGGWGWVGGEGLYHGRYLRDLHEDEKLVIPYGVFYPAQTS